MTSFATRDEEEVAGSAEMDARLGKFCGNGPGLWLRLQQTHDLWHAARLLADAVARIPSHRSAA
jgi:plasmid maintenance system antidote protein VapI